MESMSSHEAQKRSDNLIQPHDQQIETIEQQKIHDETKKKVEEITFMEYAVYSAAENGEIYPVFEERKDRLQSLLTPQKNTILHIYLTSKTRKDPDPEITKFVEGILSFCPALLMQVNTKDETPLHFAARYGHASIVQLLIEHAKKDHPDHHQQHESLDHESRGAEAAKKMLRMASKEGDTALHEAVRFRHLHVVKILISEDGDFQHKANKSGETPLYMAVERGYDKIADEILEQCNSPATGGPNDRNVLHAATIRKDQEMIEKILKKLGEEMLKKADQYGWTPLHYAARIRNFNAVRTFLENGMGREAAYMKNSDGNTALHLATVSEDWKTMREIIKQCPDSSEIVNNSGWNIFHGAVQEDSVDGVKEILRRTSLSNLINEKDAQGNTPLHHVAIKIWSRMLNDLIDDPRVDKLAFNNENKNACDIAETYFLESGIDVESGSMGDYFLTSLVDNGVRPGMRKLPIEDREKDIEMKLRKIKEEEKKDNPVDKFQDANVIVAALVATVTFAAGFTVPGGFVSEKGPLQGTPILGRNSAFKTFMVMDTIALVLSATSVLIHPFIKISGFDPVIWRPALLSLNLTISATLAMVVAFATGTYAMLGYSAVFSILICVLALSFFILFLYFMVRFFFWCDCLK